MLGFGPSMRLGYMTNKTVKRKELLLSEEVVAELKEILTTQMPWWFRGAETLQRNR